MASATSASSVTGRALPVCGSSSSSRSRCDAASSLRNAYSTGSVCTPSRRSVPGVFPESPLTELMSMMSSDTWKAVPMMSPSLDNRSTSSVVASAAIAPNRPDAAISDPVFSHTTFR